NRHRTRKHLYVSPVLRRASQGPIAFALWDDYALYGLQQSTPLVRRSIATPKGRSPLVTVGGCALVVAFSCGKEPSDGSLEGAPFSPPDDSELLFDVSVVREFHLTIPRDNGEPSSWDSIDAQAEATECVAQDRDYYVGDITVD